MYTEEAAAEMNRGIEELLTWFQQFKLSFADRRFRSERGYEHAYHGLLRRSATISHCLQAVFQQIPPRLEGIPESRSIANAEALIQASIFNLFGALDNLAWIWISESNLRRENGQELPRRQIGLGPGYDVVRASLSQTVRDELTALNDWFAHIEDFRHALAHRIPLYIPPYAIPEAAVEEYNQLSHQMRLARNRDEYSELERRQMTLVHFSPVITHSIFDQPAQKVRFHPQLIANFRTLRQITESIFLEIDKLPMRQA